MKMLDQRICAWSGIAMVVLTAVFMLLPGWVPPPSPALDAAQVAAMYRANAGIIRIGVVFGVYSAIPYTMFVGVVSVQMLRIKGISRLTPYLQLVTGIGGALAFLIPLVLVATAAFRPDQDPHIILFENDFAWQQMITNVPFVQVQIGAVALAVLQDKSANPVFPRWIAYVSIWAAVLLAPAPIAYFFKTGPFAWNGLFAFWLPANGFFAWTIAMTWATLRAISAEERERTELGAAP